MNLMLFIALAFIIIFRVVFKIGDLEFLSLELSCIYLVLSFSGWMFYVRKTKTSFLPKSVFLVNCAYLLLFFILITIFGDAVKLFKYCLLSIPVGLFFNIVCYNFATSVLEEIVFRRYLLNFCLSKMSVSIAIFTSALIFFLLHSTFMPTPFFLGIVLAYLAVRYESIVPGIFLHLIFNTIIYISKTSQLQQFQFVEKLNGGQILSAAAVMVLFLFMISILLHYFLRKMSDRFKRYRNV